MRSLSSGPWAMAATLDLPNDLKFLDPYSVSISKTKLSTIGSHDTRYPAELMGGYFEV